MSDQIVSLSGGSAGAADSAETPASDVRPSHRDGPPCRFCGAPLRHTLVDLGMSPLCETYLTVRELNQMEPFYPLKVYVCGDCFLVQLEEYVTPEGIFSHYPYFSSYSESWLRHAERYAGRMIERLGLGPRSRVVELGSNDGYLLQYFVAAGIPALGIEPARNVADAAVARGVPTRVAFFGVATAQALRAEGVGGDLVIGNNVLAQVPDLNDFVAGVKVLLNPAGVVTMEFPHLVRLVAENQFDTIYHEHFSYFSLAAVERVFAAHGLAVFDVEELPSHGGSLRIYAAHDETRPATSPQVADLRQREEQLGVRELGYYAAFGPRVEAAKRSLLRFLIDAKDHGRTVAGYGAPGKGNTLLNYCGIRTDLVAYTVDRNPYKQGRFLPGTHIPIFPPERLFETRPDYVLILPWNLKDEIMKQVGGIRAWGGRFVVPIPDVRLYP